jgi:hypothetical protein
MANSENFSKLMIFSKTECVFSRRRCMGKGVISKILNFLRVKKKAQNGIITTFGQLRFMY